MGSAAIAAAQGIEVGAPAVTVEPEAKLLASPEAASPELRLVDLSGLLPGTTAAEQIADPAVHLMLASTRSRPLSPVPRLVTTRRPVEILTSAASAWQRWSTTPSL